MSDEEREVIAYRNNKNLIMNFIFVAIGLGGSAYLAYLVATTPADSKNFYTFVGVLVILALFAALYILQVVLILIMPEEIIVKSGDNLTIGRKTVAVNSVKQVKSRLIMARGGEFALGIITAVLKNGKKVRAIGVEDAEKAQKKLEGIITPKPVKRTASAVQKSAQTKPSAGKAQSGAGSTQSGSSVKK